MVDQSLPLCILFSIFGALASALQYPSIIIYKRNANGTRLKKAFAVICNLIMQGVSFGLYTLAPWYGPVSIYRPTANAARLLFNMIIIGKIMRYDTFDKKTQLATFFILTASVTLPIVGPGVQEDQDFMHLLMRPYALAWFSFMSIIFFVSLYFMLTHDLNRLKDSRPLFVELILLGVSIFACVLSATVSRSMTMVKGGHFAAFLIFYIVLNVAWVWDNYAQGTAAPSLAKLVPIYVGGNVILNAISGIVIWEDWRVTESWTGYVMVLLQMILAIYLMSDYDLISIQKKNEANRKVLVWKSISDLTDTSDQSVSDQEEPTEQEEVVVVIEEEDEKEVGVAVEGEEGPTDMFETMDSAQR